MANTIQGDLFGTEEMIQNPLTNRRVCLVGKFSNKAALFRKVKTYGAVDANTPSLVTEAHIVVIGDDLKQDEIDKMTCYEHDGWHPIHIKEEDLNNIFAGHYSGYETPEVMKKCISIDMSYYRWTPPALYVDEESGESTLKSSPLIYAEGNPIYGLELYVPEIKGINMNAFRQLIGNLGGYANAEYYDDTNVVLLSDDTLRKLEQGEKDEVIRYIEDKYNNGKSNKFNVQFTCQTDFINWVKARIEKFPDRSTASLLARL